MQEKHLIKLKASLLRTVFQAIKLEGISNWVFKKKKQPPYSEHHTKWEILVVVPLKLKIK